MEKFYTILQAAGTIIVANCIFLLVILHLIGFYE
jgi:hypothetical protein